MADFTTLDSFIAAQNFCTGSQTDYSTCIANNMKFTPFLDDTYQASGYAGLSIANKDLPLLFGDVYVDLQPLALANIFARIKMTNSYGGVSFRCSEVFNRPRLPLPSLQDLGIPEQDIVNIIGVDPTDPANPGLEFNGVPISADDNLLGWMLNYINLMIGYTTAVSNTITKGKTIKGIILDSLDYYTLPSISLEQQSEANRSLLLYDEAIRYMNLVTGDISSDTLLDNTIVVLKDLLGTAESYMITTRTSINNDVVIPLSIIDENTDFTTFDFSITDAVADTITMQETDYYPLIFSFAMQGKYVSAVYGIPPAYPTDNELVSKTIVDVYTSNLRNLISASLSDISSLYSASTTIPLITDSLRSQELLYNDLSAQSSYYITGPRATITDPAYQDVIDELEILLATFSYGGIMDAVDLVYDDQDLESLKLVQAELDTYFDTIGNVSSIQIAALTTAMQDLYDTTLDDRITEIFLGGDFKDAGEFYYADLAYAVGYAKLTDLKSIQIDDEYYELTSTQGISEAGCTRYTFTRHVLPTYDVEVEMYVYPGTLDQPYCPTINKYHNYATSKYSGMFTKVDGENMGVYIYRGYQPMLSTVEEVIQIGAMDLNSINLNDPSLDEKSYDAILMKEIKNLSNSSSISSGPVTTEDLKYYLSSELIDDTIAANYPGLAIIEFKNFPVGDSMKFPSIKVNVVSEDLVI